MANEDTKDFNAMLQDSKDMPKFQTITDEASDDKTPFWRTLKANGELNEKYPGGALAQKEKLEAEGHTIIQKGRKNIKYYVKDYERVLFELS